MNALRRVRRHLRHAVALRGIWHGAGGSDGARIADRVHDRRCRGRYGARCCRVEGAAGRCPSALSERVGRLLRDAALRAGMADASWAAGQSLPRWEGYGASDCRRRAEDCGMSGFSPEWLALREPVDHRSRNAELARRSSARFQARSGRGRRSGLRHRLQSARHRAVARPRRSWTLVDYDRRLLAAAREALPRWADTAGGRRTAGPEQGWPADHGAVSPGRSRCESRCRARRQARPRHGLGVIRPLLVGLHRTFAARGRRTPGRLLHRADLQRHPALGSASAHRHRHDLSISRAPDDRQGIWPIRRTDGSRSSGRCVSPIRLQRARGR